MAEDAEPKMAQMPLQGAILCCTSIPPEKRADLACVASEMGASHRLDLTSDCTHLLVGDSDTPKYKYVARYRPDVKVLLPDWVDALRQLWIQGEEIDVEALEAKFTLPVFHGLRICVTGFDEVDYRQHLMDNIIANGGDYRGDLTREVTHLIAKSPAGKKYEYAGAWGVKVVSTEWLRDSLERGMTLDETLYDPRMPIEERGKEAWIRRTASTSSLGKRARDDVPALNAARKLRRTASAKLGSQNESIWTDIVGGGFGQEGRDKSESEDQRGTGEDAVDRSSRTLVLGEVTAPDAPSSDVGAANGYSTRDMLTVGAKDQSGVKGGIFYGKSFFIHGFDERKSSILNKHLCSHDADITSSLSELAQRSTQHGRRETFLIVPFSTLERDVPSTPDPSVQPVTVTDMWVERCLHRKAFVEPQENVANTPLSQYPIPDMIGMTVCSTGFSGIDLLHISRVVRQIGATYDEYLTCSTSVLLSRSLTQATEKLRHAQQWAVPIVSEKWLWDCAREGARKPLRPYFFQVPAGRVELGVVQGGRPRQFADSRGTGQVDGPSDREISLVAPEGERGRPKDTARRQQAGEAAKHKGDGVRASQPPTRVEARPPPVGRRCPIVIDDSDDDNNNDAEDDTLRPPPDDHEEADKPETANSAPLRELSPNSPSKPSSSSSHLPPTKRTTSTTAPTDQPKPSLPGATEDALPATIAAFLAETKTTRARTASANTTSAAVPGPRPPTRRRRALLGRAPSNVSAVSAGSLSRASSISVSETLNTDGVGTPVDADAPAAAAEASASASASGSTMSFLLKNSFDHGPATGAAIEALRQEERRRERDLNPDDDDHDATEFRATQLGYADPEVGAWRERMVGSSAAAMGRGKGGGETEDVHGGKVRDVVRHKPGAGAGAKSTRLRAARKPGF